MERETVHLIQQFIEEKKRVKRIVNTVIRDDIFSVLDNECNVLYYGLEDEIEARLFLMYTVHW